MCFALTRLGSKSATERSTRKPKLVAFQAHSTLPIDCAVYFACHRAGDDPTLRNGEAAA
jgi:hypothetical protein